MDIYSGKKKCFICFRDYCHAKGQGTTYLRENIFQLCGVIISDKLDCTLADLPLMLDLNVGFSIYLLGCGKYEVGVGGDGVDWTIMCLDFTQLLTIVDVPHLEVTSPTTA